MDENLKMTERLIKKSKTKIGVFGMIAWIALSFSFYEFQKLGAAKATNALCKEIMKGDKQNA